MANAVTASLNCLTPPPIAMNACWSAEGDLQVAVYDHGVGTPELREEPPDEEEHGRGLLLLNSWARQRDVCHHAPGSGKTITFQL